MKLHWYVFRQVFSASFMVVALFVFVLVLGNIIKEVADLLGSGRISGGTFFYIIALLIPSVIPYCLPMGVLAGVMLTLGRMSSQNEIMAAKSLGISLYSIASSIFLVAMIGTLVSLGINFYYAPAANFAYKKTLKNVIRQDPIKYLQPNAFIKDFPGYVIFIKNKDGKNLDEFLIWQLDEKNRVDLFAKAKTCVFEYEDKSDDIILNMIDAVGEKRYDKDPENFHESNFVGKMGNIKLKISLAKILENFAQRKYKPSLMTFDELLSQRTSWRTNPNKKEYSAEELAVDKMKIQVQIQKSFAMAFSIFSMVFFAVPLAIKTSRTETFINLAIALVLALTYYMMSVFIGWLVASPSLRPDVLIWVPNILFMSLGIILFRRSSMH